MKIRMRHSRGGLLVRIVDARCQRERALDPSRKLRHANGGPALRWPCNRLTRPPQGHVYSGTATQAGFTLVETIVTMVLALVILGATVAVLTSGQRIQARDSEWALTMQQDRAGLARMVRDIRQANKVEEVTARSIRFLATIGGREFEIEYECARAQSGTTYTQCVRLASETGKALPASGPTVARDLVNGSSVFTYTPSAASPRAAIIKLEIPAKGTLKQAASVSYTHRVVLEDAAFMRELYREG